MADEFLAYELKDAAHKPLDIIIEEARLAALDSYRVLDAGAVQGLQRLSQEAAESLAATQAAVSFVDASRVWFGGAFGFAGSGAARENSFCDVVVRSGSPLLVPDGRADPRFRQHELVQGEAGLRCYAGAPLIDHGGYTLGTVAVFSNAPGAFAGGILQDLSALAALVRDFLTESPARQPAAVSKPNWGPKWGAEPAPPRLVQGWLGVKTLSTDEGKAGVLAGLVVLSVAKGSPAAAVGIRPADILQSIGGRDLFVSSDVAEAMAGRVAGSRVTLRFRRAGEWQQADIEIKLKRRRLIGR